MRLDLETWARVHDGRAPHRCPGVATAAGETFGDAL
jgi:hypothetical protein